MDSLVFLVAGFLAGAVNVAVGAGTLVSFPLLVLAGVPPLTATVSNTIGIVPGSVAGTYAYRRELRRLTPAARVLLPASALGGVLGSLLLLRLPAEVFSAVVPWLIGVGTVLVLLGPTIRRVLARGDRMPPPRPSIFGSRAALVGSIAGAFCLGTYGGYFSAAQGVLLVAVLGISTTLGLQDLNALKNLSVAAVNTIAAIVFVVVSPQLIDVRVASLVALGSVIGGLLGGRFARRLPAPVFRGFVVVMGVVAVVVLTVGRGS